MGIFNSTFANLQNPIIERTEQTNECIQRKKSRQESLAGGYVDPRTKREKDEQAKDRRSNALYIAIAVIFVIVGIVVTVANSKVIERNADAVTIGNETYTAADVSYFYNTIYSSFVSKNSYYLSAYGLDTSKSLKEQDCPVTDGGTGTIISAIRHSRPQVLRPARAEG